MRAELEAENWSLILCDHKLPKFSSMMALEVLREFGVDMPFIIVSGSIGEDMTVAVMRTGAHDYIIKERLAPLVPDFRERKDGSLYPVETRHQLYTKEEPPVFVAIIQDITGRKRAEEEIQHQKTMFESIFNGVADAIVLTDPQRKIVTCNAISEKEK